MKKMIKKCNSKWILLILLMLSGVGMQGQIDRTITFTAKPVQQPDGNEYEVEYNENGTLKSWLHEVVIPVQVLKDMGIPNVSVDIKVMVNAVNQSYDASGLSGSILSNSYFNSFLVSLYSTYGDGMRSGDSGSFEYEVNGGGGGSYAQPCTVTSCPVGYNLVNCECVEKPKDPCIQAKKNDARVINSVILNQNKEIRTQSTAN